MKYCEQCGSQLNDGAKFCVKCGAPSTYMPEAGNEKRTPDNNKTPDNKKKSPLLFIIIGIIVLLGIGLAVFFALKNKDRDSDYERKDRIEEDWDEDDEREREKSAGKKKKAESIEASREASEAVTEAAKEAVTEAAKEAAVEAVTEKKINTSQASRIEMTDPVPSKNHSTYTISFVGVGGDGSTLWEIKTDTLPYTELENALVLGINDGYGYVYWDGVKKIDLTSGSVIWSADAGGGSPSWDFDLDGNLYIIGYYDDVLCKVDPKGKVTRSVSADPYYWPYKVRVLNGAVQVQFEMPEDRMLEYNKSDLKLLSDTHDTSESDKYSQIYDYAKLFSDAEKAQLNSYLTDIKSVLGTEVILSTASYDPNDSGGSGIDPDNQVLYERLNGNGIILEINQRTGSPEVTVVGPQNQKIGDRVSDAVEGYEESMKRSPDYMTAVMEFFSEILD